MTRERDELVDEFLADLGSAPVPHDLATMVARRLREERPPRAHRQLPLLAAAAVVAATLLAGLVWVAGGPGPAPGPTPSPTAPASSAGPSSSPSAEPTPSDAASPAPTPPVTGLWDVDLPSVESSSARMALRVTDRTGTIANAVPATSFPSTAAPGDPHGLVFGPGRTSMALVVGWTGGVCDERGILDLQPDGRTFTLALPQPVGCDAIGIGFAVELTFVRPVDAAAFVGSWRDDLVSVQDVSPTSVAFATPEHGWVGGTTPGGDAIVLETLDGGHTWRVGRLGSGQVSDVGVAGDRLAWAGRVCVEAAATCHPGLYRQDDSGLWGWADKAWPTRLSFSGQDGAALFMTAGASVDGAGAPVPEVRLSSDGGETWTTVTSPCPATLRTQDVTRVDAATVVVVCESEGATGNASKALYRSTDAGRTWSKLADGPNSGTGMGLALRSDATGWLWGARSPLLATRDGGKTWTALGVADGDVRIVEDGDAWGGGAGVVLVFDPDRPVTLLLRTNDGQTWTELFAWPTPVRCCG